MAGRAELAALLQRAEAEGAAIIEIQRLDADLAEASAKGGTAESSERRRAEHARAVQTVLSALPTWKSACVIQQAFRGAQSRKSSTQAAERDAEARAKAAEDARAAERDTEEDKAIIANLCSREDLHYPTAGEVRDALKLARGTKARMPEVVRLLRRKRTGASEPRSPYSSPIRAEKRLRPVDPVDVDALPLIEAFMLLRERVRSAPGDSPPSSPPSGTARGHNQRGEEMTTSDAVHQLQKQIVELRAEKDAQAKNAAVLSAQLSEANAQLSKMRLELSDAKMAAHRLQAPTSFPATPVAAQEEPSSSMRAEWDSAATNIQAQYTRWRHMQDMRTLMDAAKRETGSLKATLADRNSQLQAHSSRIKILDASNAQLVSQGSAQILSIEKLQEELRNLEEWQRGQHQFVAEQQTMQEEAAEALRAQHTDQLQAQAEAGSIAAEQAAAAHASAIEMLRAEMDAAAQETQEMATAHAQQLQSLRDEMEEQAREAHASARNQDLVIDEVTLEASSLREHHADAVRRHESALAAHASDIAAHQVKHSQLQSEHDHHRTLAEAHKEEATRMQMSLESAKNTTAATHIQMEYHRMRAQQDLREIQKQHRSKFSELKERHDLVASEHAEATAHIHHNASSALQLQFHRKQAHSDMRNLLAAHRDQMATHEATTNELREQLAAHKKQLAVADAEVDEEKERLHTMHRDSLSELRAKHDDHIAKLEREHDQRVWRKLDEMRAQHAQTLNESASEAAEATAHLRGLLHKATETHQASMADLKKRFEAESAPSQTELEEVESKAQTVAATHDGTVEELRSDLRKLEDENRQWKELAQAAHAQAETAKVAAGSATVRTEDTASSPLAPTPRKEEVEEEAAPQTQQLGNLKTPRRNEPTSEETAVAMQARLESMPSVQAARAKVVFRRYDADADGFLNLRELREMMAETGEPGYYMTQEEYESMCESLGCEHTAGISLEKFISMYQPPLANQLGSDITKDFAIVAGSWIFEMYDTDEDGFLNLDEARQLQMDTVPDEAAISENQFERLCAMLGCSTTTGIDLDTFVTAYCPPLCQQLGWDVAKDFSLVAGQMIAQQYDIDALGIVVPGMSNEQGSVFTSQADVERIRQLEAELDVQQQEINEALVARDGAVREMQAAEKTAASTVEKLEAAGAKIASEARDRVVSSLPESDPLLFEELAKWKALAEQAQTHAQQGRGGTLGRSSDSVDSSMSAPSSVASLAAEEEIEAWTTFAQSLADETVRSMNFLVVKSAQVRAGPKLASPTIGKLPSGEIVRVVSTKEVSEKGKVVVRGQIMTTNFPDGWVSLRIRDSDGSGDTSSSAGDLILLKRIWPAAMVTPQELQEQFIADAIDDEITNAVMGAVAAAANPSKPLVKAPKAKVVRRAKVPSDDGSDSGSAEEQMAAALGLATGVVASASAVRAEVEELQTRLDTVETERDELKGALETAETVESAVVTEAVTAMETAAQVATRCRERVAELQAVVDTKDRAVEEHRQARQRLEEEMATILNDVTSEARRVEAIEADYRKSLTATQNAAQLAIEQAKSMAKGVAEGAAQTAETVIADLSTLVKDNVSADFDQQQQQQQQQKPVSRLDLQGTATAGGGGAAGSPANMPPLPNSPPTTAAAGPDTAEAKRVRSLQLQDEMELNGGQPAPAPAQAQAATTTTAMSAARREIEELYGRYNPEKLGDVDTLLSKYGEDRLLSMVRKKYRAKQGGAAPAPAALVKPSGKHEREVFEFLQRRQQAELTVRVCKAFETAHYSPHTWLQELKDMQRKGELDRFMQSVMSASPTATAGSLDPSAIRGATKVTFSQKSGALGIAWQDRWAKHPDGSGAIQSVVVMTSMKAGLPAAQGLYAGPRVKQGLALASIEGGVPGSPDHKQVDVLGLGFEEVIKTIRAAKRPLSMVLFPPALVAQPASSAAGPEISIRFEAPGALGLTLEPLVANQPKHPVRRPCACFFLLLVGHSLG
jgi:Ca2+-binding EF-hand superfamily protein